MENLTRVASLLDPAIDLIEMGQGMREYAETRDEKHLRFTPGASPAWYYLRRIPTSVYVRYVSEATSDADRRRRAFQAAFVKAENVPNDDGARVTIEPTGQVQAAAGPMKALSDSDLDRFPPSIVEEIGAVADQLSFLARGNEARFSLPPSFLAALARRAAQDAERTAKAQAPNSGEAAEPQAQPSASNTEGPGDATATA